MLTHDLFNTGIARLVKVMRPKEWDYELEIEYYHALQNFADNEFAKCIEVSLRKFKFMPKPSEMADIMETDRRSTGTRREERRFTDPDKESCGQCARGLIFYIVTREFMDGVSFDHEYDFVCACTCDLGEKYSRGKRGMATWNRVCVAPANYRRALQGPQEGEERQRRYFSGRTPAARGHR